ncbi:MAG TPA: outer membrane beta-barrel protein [Saprospiraceae bacterium]|nr:PorT family protein [Lewinellaceae bacterium]HRX28382.1 outer membrane beta-barrel protein [Saprospiraceae bacterium]
MEGIKLRNLFNIHGSKITFIFILSFFIGSTLMAQRNYRGNYNYKDFQKKPYYFGLTIGVNSSNYKVGQSKFFINNDSIDVVSGLSGIGINLHMIANLKLGEFFDFRFLPGFAFSNRSFQFKEIDTGLTVDRSIESVFFELPFHIRFKSEPYKDKRFFVLGGLKYNYDVSSNSSSRKARTLIKISPHDFQWEVGLGAQFFFPYFIFSPEIKFSRGLGNILIYDNLLYESRVMENVVSEIFTISFHFEG